MVAFCTYGFLGNFKFYDMFVVGRPAPVWGARWPWAPAARVENITFVIFSTLLYFWQHNNKKKIIKKVRIPINVNFVVFLSINVGERKQWNIQKRDEHEGETRWIPPWRASEGQH